MSVSKGQSGLDRVKTVGDRRWASPPGARQAEAGIVLAAASLSGGQGKPEKLLASCPRYPSGRGQAKRRPAGLDPSAVP